MTGMSRGSESVPESAVCRPSVGAAIASRSAVAAIAATSGRRRETRSTAFQTRDWPSARFMRHSSGTLPLSMRSPSQLSIAGMTVREPSIAAATTMIVPRPKPMNVLSPVRNMPAIAMITVRPDTRTARPEVAAAISIASRGDLPAARSSRSRRR